MILGVCFFLMNRIWNFVINKVTWKKAAVFTVLFAVVFMVINYSGIGVAGLLRITGGANILDNSYCKINSSMI